MLRKCNEEEDGIRIRLIGFWRWAEGEEKIVYERRFFVFFIEVVLGEKRVNL